MLRKYTYNRFDSTRLRTNKVRDSSISQNGRWTIYSFSHSVWSMSKHNMVEFIYIYIYIYTHTIQAVIYTIQAVSIAQIAIELLDWLKMTCVVNCQCMYDVIPPSHQTSSHNVFTTFFRTGSEQYGCQKILSRFKVLDVLAHSVSLYYIQEVRIQFEPVLKNVVRTSLVWQGFKQTKNTRLLQQQQQQQQRSQQQQQSSRQSSLQYAQLLTTHTQTERICHCAPAYWQQLWTLVL